MRSVGSMAAALRDRLGRFVRETDPRVADADAEDAVGLLSEDEKQHPPSDSDSPQEEFGNGKSRKAWLFLPLGGILLLLIVLVVGIQLPFGPATPVTSLQQEDHFLHIAIPQLWSPTASLELCQAVLTAGTLGYPTPWTLNWNTTSDAEGNVVDATWSKLEHVSKWLQDRPEERENDTVVILGNNKSWFQLRPEVLLKRYFSILEKGNKELAQHSLANVTRVQRIGAKVVFATQQECLSQDEASCQPFEAEDKSVHYLSADFAMGPLKDLKPMWQRAASRAVQMAAKDATIDEHSIFASLLADQQRHRQKAREQSHAEDLPATEDDVRDFGIALDFGNELSYAAPRNTDDTAWVKHQKINKREARQRVSPADLYLPQDIAASAPPFWTLDGVEVLPNTTWHDVRLLTVIDANSVPAIVQRGAAARPTLATTWWENMWFQPYARRLLDNFVLTPIVPIAILTGEDGNEIRYWSRLWQKVGVVTAEDAKFKKWKNVCNTETMAGSLFVDGLGPWVDPRP